MKLLYPKKDFLTYKEALALFEDGEVPYEPFCVVEEENVTHHGKKLLIGYKKDGSAIFIQDRTIEHIKSKDEVEAYKVSKMGINTYYKKVARPRESMDSILRKPKVGDTVLCVANERYVGATFGETYEVKEITHEGRLAFEYGAQYTYESKYFVVIKESRNIIAGHIHNLGSFVKPTSDDVVDAMGYAIKYGTTTARVALGLDPYKDTFGIDTDDDDELIVRKKLSNNPIRARKVFDATLIERSK
jgi:hypothetical protein